MGAPFSLDPSATAAFAKLEQDVGAQALHDTAAPVKAVVIGGGTGAPVSIRTLLSLEADTSAVVAMADDGAPQVGAIAAAEESIAGIGLHRRFNVEVLGMGIKCVRRHPAYGDRRIFIGTEEVSHIHQKSEIGVVHSGDKFFHPFAVLYKGAMILDHGFDTLFSGVLRYLAAGAGDYG